MDTKRKASYNLDEIKVRWKKAALENCPGVPCVVTPPTPASACGSITTVLDGDGISYETVAIGNQCWTKTNLKTKMYIDGITSIPDETANPGWGTLGYGALTEFVGVTDYVSKYGYLYNGYAVAGIITPGGPSIKNICPVGWRVPSNSDWNKLVIFIDSGADTTSASFVQSSAITSLKKNDASWYFNTGTNTSGFSALPGGFRGSSFFPFSNRYDAAFWSTTELPMQPNFNLVRDIQEPSDTFRKVPQDKSFGLSVRCLKD